jgi:hypothetical protein
MKVLPLGFSAWHCFKSGGISFFEPLLFMVALLFCDFHQLRCILPACAFKTCALVTGRTKWFAGYKGDEVLGQYAAACAYLTPLYVAYLGSGHSVLSLLCSAGN